MTREVVYEYLLTVPQNFTVRDWINRLGHGRGGWLIVPALTCEDNPEPVNDCFTINFGYGVDGGPLETAPRLNRCEIVLEEHAHVGFWEVNFLSDENIVHTGIFGDK